MQLRRPTTNQSQQRSTGDTILTWLRASVISSPFLLTPHSFSFCPTIFLSRSISYWHERVKISCGLTRARLLSYDWMSAGLFMRFMFLLPGSALVIRHFSESPRLSLTLSSQGWMIWVTRSWSWRWLIWISLSCCLVFVKSHLVTCHIQTNINSVMKHKYSWVMSDHLGSHATGMMRLFFLLIFSRMCCISGQTPGHLFPDPGNYTTLLPRPAPGQSGHISLDIFISDQVQFSSSPVINVTPHPYFSFQGRRRLFTLLNCLRILILVLR